MTKPITQVPAPGSRDSVGPSLQQSFRSTDWYIDVLRGAVPGHSIIHKFGRRTFVPNGSWVHLNWLGAGNWQLQTATTVRIKAGGDANDTAAGSGAREITVEGLDETLALATEPIATAGAAASAATTTTFLRPYRAWVSANGTYASANAGLITVENGAGGTDLIAIAGGTPRGEGQTQFSGYTVAAGQTGYVLGADVTVDSNKVADVRFCQLRNIDDTVVPVESVRLIKFWDGVVGRVEYRPRAPHGPFPEKTDIWFEGYGDGGSAQVAADFEMLLVDN